MQVLEEEVVGNDIENVAGSHYGIKVQREATWVINRNNKVRRGSRGRWPEGTNQRVIGNDKPASASGAATFSGDAVTTAFNITHRLYDTPPTIRTDHAGQRGRCPLVLRHRELEHHHVHRSTGLGNGQRGPALARVGRLKNWRKMFRKSLVAPYVALLMGLCVAAPALADTAALVQVETMESAQNITSLNDGIIPGSGSGPGGADALRFNNYPPTADEQDVSFSGGRRPR